MPGLNFLGHNLEIWFFFYLCRVTQGNQGKYSRLLCVAGTDCFAKKFPMLPSLVRNILEISLDWMELWQTKACLHILV